MRTGGDRLPQWLEPVAELASRITADDLAWPVPPEPSARHSAVLLLFGEGPSGPDLLLIERSRALRSHPGQPAFPGGAVEPEDDGPVAAALREAAEETGLDPSGVEVIGTLPVIHVLPSRYAVTPVLAWWREPSPVGVADPREVASVHRVPLAELTDPRNRFRVRHGSGVLGPAFGVAGLVVWGFTGGLLDRVLALSGLERPWDRSRVEDLPEDARRVEEPDRASEESQDALDVPPSAAREPRESGPPRSPDEPPDGADTPRGPRLSDPTSSAARPARPERPDHDARPPGSQR